MKIEVGNKTLNLGTGTNVVRALVYNGDNIVEHIKFNTSKSMGSIDLKEFDFIVFKDCVFNYLTLSGHNITFVGCKFNHCILNLGGDITIYKDCIAEECRIHIASEANMILDSNYFKVHENTLARLFSNGKLHGSSDQVAYEETRVKEIKNLLVNNTKNLQSTIGYKVINVPFLIRASVPEDAFTAKNSNACRSSKLKIESIDPLIEFSNNSILHNSKPDGQIKYEIGKIACPTDFTMTNDYRDAGLHYFLTLDAMADYGVIAREDIEEIKNFLHNKYNE